MDKKDRLYILHKCKCHLENAIFYKNNAIYGKMLLETYKGLGLKELIEETMDCQSNPYYNKYKQIVKLTNILDDYYY